MASVKDLERVRLALRHVPVAERNVLVTEVHEAALAKLPEADQLRIEALVDELMHARRNGASGPWLGRTGALELLASLGRWMVEIDRNL